MLDLILALGSAVMFLGSMFPSDAPPMILDVVRMTAIDSPQVLTFTSGGQCQINGVDIACHEVIAGCKLHCVAGLMTFFSMFYGAALAGSVLSNTLLMIMEKPRTMRVERMMLGAAAAGMCLPILLGGVATIIGLAAVHTALPEIVQDAMHISVKPGLGLYLCLALTVGYAFESIAWCKLYRGLQHENAGYLALAVSETDEPYTDDKMSEQSAVAS